MEDNSKVLVAALAGAVIGAGIALLIAPASGKETRENIAGKFSDAKDAIGDAKDNLLNRFSNAKDAIGEAKDNLKDNIKSKSDEIVKKATSKS